MPFDKWFRQEHEAADAMDELYAQELRESIVKLRKDLEVYETPAWAHVDQLLAAKLERSFQDMMHGDPEQMILARERARVVSDIRQEPITLREKVADLQAELTKLESEEVEGE